MPINKKSKVKIKFQIRELLKSCRLIKDIFIKLLHFIKPILVFFGVTSLALTILTSLALVKSNDNKYLLSLLFTNAVNSYLLPENLTITTQKISLFFDFKQYYLTLNLSGLKLTKQNQNILTLPNLTISVDLYKLLSLTNFDNLAIVRISDYDLSLENITFQSDIDDVKIDYIELRKYIVRYAKLLPNVVFDNVIFRIKLPIYERSLFNAEKNVNGENNKAKQITIIPLQLKARENKVEQEVIIEGLFDIEGQVSEVNFTIDTEEDIKELSLSSLHLPNLISTNKAIKQGEKKPQLLLRGEINKISYSLFKGENIHFTNQLDFIANIWFKIYLTDNFTLSNIDFSISSHEGQINTSEFWPTQINLKQLHINGSYFIGRKNLIFENINIQDQRNLNLSGKLNAYLDKGVTDINLSLTDLPISDLYNYWPTNLVNKTRNWLYDNLKTGIIDKAQLSLHIDNSLLKANQGILLADHLKAEISLKDTTLNNYHPNQNKNIFIEKQQNSENININKATVVFNSNSMKAIIPNATLNDLKLNNFTVNIDNFYNNPTLLIEGNVVSNISSIINWGAKHVNLNYLNDDKQLQKNNLLLLANTAEGLANTHFSLGIPLKKESTKPVSPNLKLNGKVSKFYLPKIAQKFSFKSELLNFNLEKNKLEINAKGIINNSINSTIVLKTNLKSSKNFETTKINHSKFDLNVNFSAKAIDFNDIGINIDEIAQGNITGEVSVSNIDNKQTIVINTNLINTKIHIPELSIDKTIGEIGNFYCLLYRDLTKNDNKLEITNYEIKIPQLQSVGSGLLNYNLGQLISIKSQLTKIHNGNFHLNYFNDKEHQLELSGNSLDLSNLNIEKLRLFKKKKKIIKPISVTASLNKLILKDNKELINPTFKILCDNNKCSKLTFNGFWNDYSGLLTIFYDFPVLAIVSNNAGNLLKGLGLYDNMKRGNIEIKMNLTNNHSWQGNLFLNNFTIVNAPILAELLKLAAITSNQFFGIFRLLNIGGIDFSQLECAINSDNKIIDFSKCSIKGESLAIKGNGIIDLDNQKVKFNGIILPTHILNTVLNIIQKLLPSIKDDLIEGSEDRVNFVIEGDIKGKLKLQANPLSIMAPGFIGQLFEFGAKREEFNSKK